MVDRGRMMVVLKLRPVERRMNWGFVDGMKIATWIIDWRIGGD